MLALALIQCLLHVEVNRGEAHRQLAGPDYLYKQDIGVEPYPWDIESIY